MTRDHKAPRIVLPLTLLAVAVVLGATLVGYRPDRAVPVIVPGSSAGPTFVVQVIRPRAGLPLAGLLPPRLFGLESHLGFDSTSPGARVGGVGPRRFELHSDDWDLALVVDAEGQVTAETEVVFEIVFQERQRRVRCRPGDPPVGDLETALLPGTDELSGRFDIDLARCEDAETGVPLGWPPRPFRLHGSFDRLRPGAPPSESPDERSIGR